MGRCDWSRAGAIGREMNVYIYGLKDPETKEIRYVGKSAKPKARYRQHIKNCDLVNNHKRSWIKNLAEKGFVPELEILETTDQEHWELRERYWIKYGLDNDWPLTNISSGGAFYPAPIPARYQWHELIKSYLPLDEWAKFCELSIEAQIDICHKTAIRMMEFTWTGIRNRGGNPEREYSRDKQYWAMSDMARSLLTLYGS